MKAIEISFKVAKALRDIGGSSQKYQFLVLQLGSVAETLEHLARLQVNSSNHEHADTIRRMASVAYIPLHSFSTKLQKYDAHLSAEAKHKFQWGKQGFYKIAFAL